MKKSFKTFLSLLMVICLLSTTAFAAGTDDGDYGVMPCFDHISSVAVGLSISLSGKSTCTTSITLYDSSHSATVDMILYRYDGTTWEEVKNWVYSDDGPDIAVQKHWYVNSGYDYQVQSFVSVYDADGNLIEAMAGDSPVKSY